MILHLVTDRTRLCPGRPFVEVRACLLEQIREAAAAGVDVVQIREPTLEAGPLMDIVRQAISIARPKGTRILVNDRLDVALAAGADGVHLKAASVPPAAARAAAPAGFLVGRSVHGLEEALDAASRADYMIAGTIWPTESKAPGHPLLGLEGLATIARSVAVPVIAIGGIALPRLAELKRTGAAGVAAVGLFMRAAGPTGTHCRVQSLEKIVESARLAFDTGRSAS